MRAHGIPVPDPIVEPNGAVGMAITAGNGVNPHSEAFRQADAICKRDLPKTTTT